MRLRPYPADGSRSFRETEIRYASVMKFPRYLLLPVTISALMLVAAGPVLAQSSPRQDRQEAPPREAARQDRPLHAPPPRTRRSSLSDAVRRVQRETGGQVLGAERVQFDGRDINRIKVIDDRGRVRYMDDDPQQGRGQERREAPPARGDNPPTP